MHLSKFHLFLKKLVHKSVNENKHKLVTYVISQIFIYRRSCLTFH